MTAEESRTQDAFVSFGLTPVASIEGGSRDAGAGILVQLRNALAPLEPGALVELRSTRADLREDLRGWCRISSNELIACIDAGAHTKYLIRKGDNAAQLKQPEWRARLGPRHGGGINLRNWLVGERAFVPEIAPAYLGFVPRGAVVEPGLPEYPFTLNHKAEVWTETVLDLYEQATSQQWSVNVDIPWQTLPSLPEDLEQAVCQVMTFLAENEYAALYIPAKFLPRINAQFIEVVLFLGTVINDEARHIEAFTKRAIANGGGLQRAATLTEWSLHSLLIQEDYFRVSFLLHVLGEGTFLELLEFVERFAPDPVTAEVARRARLDEGRHVAYGIAHARELLTAQPARQQALLEAAEERASALRAVSASNPVLMESLAALAGGGSGAEQMRVGLEAVGRLAGEMHSGRVRRLQQIGFDRAAAEELSAMHTPNFM
jgi:hypothetical protein